MPKRADSGGERWKSSSMGGKGVSACCLAHLAASWAMANKL